MPFSLDFSQHFLGDCAYDMGNAFELDAETLVNR